MADDCFYTEITTSKDGNLIPLCGNTALHSKYSTQREAETFASQFEESGFFIIFGLCGGYHIDSLSRKFPDSKILAVEVSDAAIDFLSSIPSVNELKNSKRIFIASLENFQDCLLQKYIPAIDGNITAKALRSWENLFPEHFSKAKEIFNESIKKISADYSVQKHFGKLWQKNILSNLAQSANTASFQDFVQGLDRTKTAAIIAAGPSLNTTIAVLSENREKYCIIATDTASGSLSKHKLTPDFIVSVDGQLISHSHYLEQLKKDTGFVFDLCANPSAVRKAVDSGCKVLLTESGHPLSSYASHYRGKTNFMQLETGSGTVTIAAAAFAVKAGFSTLKFFGADFSYIDFLPYAKGTYLDTIYRKDEDRISTAEKKFANLLYRTPVIELSKNRITTEVLKSYKESLEIFLLKYGLKKISEDSYEIKTKGTSIPRTDRFDLADFKKAYEEELEELFEGNLLKKNAAENPVFATLIPFCASLGQGCAFLAYSKTLSYTREI